MPQSVSGASKINLIATGMGRKIVILPGCKVSTVYYAIPDTILYECPLGRVQLIYFNSTLYFPKQVVVSCTCAPL
jgi:hypothetical protein